ncbi:DUF4190 domain-containing protein [Hugenholtzia roseola]|uniref:DUF4190 domain-containing protein n=1 Tax=Hugenholtzia roseola TaxID=1002 RepID=UPI00040826A0|nr:DUF4190 domain-containing protein [Hugenholtzia roseola]
MPIASFQKPFSRLMAAFFLCFLMVFSFGLDAASNAKAEIASSDKKTEKNQTLDPKNRQALFLENSAKNALQKQKISNFERILQKKIAQKIAKQVEKKKAKNHKKAQKNATTTPHSDYEPTSLISFGLSLVGIICLLLAFGGSPFLFFPMAIFGLAGMIVGYVSLGERKRSGSKGLGFSILGIILGKIAFLAALLIVAVLLSFAFGW